MKLRINGEDRRVEGCKSVEDLLRVLDLRPARVVVVLNDAVVPALERGDHFLNDGDRLELVTLVAGG